MPNVTLVRDHLFAAIGKTFTEKEFDELCFEFGVEVDDVETEVVEFTGDGTKEEHVVYVIAIPANRYDLLCMEGFARAIRVFLGLESAPTFKTITTENPSLKMVVEPATSTIRPYVCAAVLRGIKFDKLRYKSFIDLQEKLHQNICRKRSYVAIGTHDISTVQGPFRYRALPPQEINFVPLTEGDNGKSFNGKELMDHYREDVTCKHLKPYTDLIYSSPVYPVIMDKDDRVLSLPPIINSRHSRITLDTTDVLIECTGTDLTKTNIVLDTVVTMFSEYCATPFTAETVEIEYLEAPAENVGLKHVTPLLSTRQCDTKMSDIAGIMGVTLEPAKVVDLCNRMQLGPSEYVADKDIVRVTVPPTRSDVLHPIDVVEDVAIAYGYNNLPIVLDTSVCTGSALPINQFTDLLRQEVARAGYMEMLTHGLCSRAENFTDLNRPVGPAVALSNPANEEYEVVRTTLIPGALKTLSFNKALSHKDGVKLFEISDVVLIESNDVGARNERHFCALYAAHSADFEVIHGLVDKVMTAIQIAPEESYAASSLSPEEMADRKRVSRAGIHYFLRANETDGLFFPGMSADVIVRFNDDREVVVGSLGVVHPTVLNKYDISYPATVVELNLELLQ